MKSFINIFSFLPPLFEPSSERKKELEEAKQIFYSFDCNNFFIMKEGMSKEYERYHVGKSQENKWRDEFIADWLERILQDGFSMQALWHIRNAGSTKSIPTLMEIAKKEDSYAKYWIADTIWWLSEDILFGSKQGRTFAIILYEELLEHPISISVEHLAEIMKILPAFNARSPEEYILARAKQDLMNIKNRNK